MGALRYKMEHGKLSGFAGSDDMSNEEILEIECDILVPAALESVITERTRTGSKPR